MELLHGDCIGVMAGLPAASVGAVVTDPPYGLEFMGKDWDRPWAVASRVEVGIAGKNMALPTHRDSRNANCRTCGGRQRGANRCGCETPKWDRHPREDMVAFQAWSEDWAREALRVLKPGGYLVAFGGSRTYHRMACAIEDAGFVIKDSLMWLYGSGFPKSLNLGDGIGTALKPAHEPIVLAQRPLAGTYAANVARWGVGGLNIDGCRVDLNGEAPPTGSGDRRGGAIYAQDEWTRTQMANGGNETSALGRWPANVLLDEEAAAILDAQTGTLSSNSGKPFNRADVGYHGGCDPVVSSGYYGDSGGASRFFYVAKAARSEREKGLRALSQATPGERTGRADGSAGLDSPRAGAGRTNAGANIHPTVKPVQLMRWLVRLVTPPGETVLDPFLGSGTTGVAATMEGRDFIGIEREAQYLEIARHRLVAAQPGLPLGAA